MRWGEIGMLDRLLDWLDVPHTPSRLGWEGDCQYVLKYVSGVKDRGSERREHQARYSQTADCARVLTVWTTRGSAKDLGVAGIDLQSRAYVI